MLRIFFLALILGVYGSGGKEEDLKLFYLPNTFPPGSDIFFEQHQDSRTEGE